MKPRIALIERSLHKVYRGIYRLLSETADVEILTEFPEPIDSIRVTSFKSIRLLGTSFVHYAGLYSYLKKKKFDIICVRPYYRPYSLVALFYALWHKKKFIIMEEQRNDPHNIFERMVFNFLLLFLRPLINKNAHAVICLTKPCTKYLQNKGFRNLTYIPVPYAPAAKSASLQNKLNIICVARFEHLKAHHILLRALAELLHSKKIRPTDLEVNLVGAGTLFSQTKKLAATLGLQNVVHFKGTIPNDQIDAYLRKHNLFVLPSISDPIGLVVLEAMANGLAVIVSSAVGAQGSVETGRNGYIFKSSEYHDLASKILLLKDPPACKRFGEESLRIIKEHHDPLAIKKQYQQILQ